MRMATASWALNRDKPYDQLVMQQLAGEQMTDWKMGEKLSPDGTDTQSIYEIEKQYDAPHAVTITS